MQVSLRAMTPEDIDDVDRVWLAAFATPEEEPRERSEREVRDERARHEHLLTNDPEGSIVAVSEGRVIGLAQAHRRGPVFVLAMLAVDPDFQNEGVGHRLLDRVLSYGADAGAAYIFSSRDPRAVYRYVRAGFDLQPTVLITPQPREGLSVHPSVRTAEGSAADLDHVDRVDHDLRGATRRVDTEFWLASGDRLLCTEDGYAFLGPNRVTALGARSVEGAEHLLQAALLGVPDDRPRGAAWVSGAQQWAIRRAAECGASLLVQGALMSRGVARLPAPYLPNGLFA